METPATPARAAAQMLEHLSIPDLIASRAAKCPDAEAFLAPDSTALTYGGLLGQVERAVQRLNELGIGRGDRVAVVLSSGVDVAYAFLAVSSAAVFAPLNPNLRAREFESFFLAMRVKAVLVHPEADSTAADVAFALEIPLLWLLPVPGEIGGEFEVANGSVSPGETVVPGFSQADDVALQLHTSGTTGRPKLVPLTHRNLTHSARDIGDAVGLEPSDRCLNVMPLHYIHGLSTVYASLAAGGSVVCTPQFDPGRFFEWMAKYRPTWYTAAPTIHQLILEQAERHRDGFPHSLRFVRSASSGMPPQVRRWIENVFGVPQIEAYGMTEASPQIASNSIAPEGRRAGSVGRAAGPEVAIMSDVGGLLPVLGVGEVVARGANVTQGYLDNPAANDAAFLNGWFRTGDQGYLDGDGFLFITGRIKEIINRGGEKISPREVDEVLLGHPSVAEAVTFPVASAKFGEDIAAAVTLKPDQATTPGELRRFVALYLADFKVPSHILIVESLPKNPTGKIQRLGMADRLGFVPFDAPADDRAVYVAPRTPAEESLRAVWREVLRVDDIGVEDTFAALGGNSLLATLALTRIFRATGVRLSLIDFFESPTVAQQARRIDASLQDTATTAPPPIARRLRPEVVPMTTSQHGLWFLDQLYPDNGAYNMHRALRLRGPLHLEALGRSLTAASRRHEVFRTVFPAVDGLPVARVLPLADVSIETIDLCKFPSATRELALRKVAALEAGKPFNLGSDPLLRAKLVKMDENDRVLILVTHHIAADGWSLGILLKELAARYSAIVAGESDALLDLPCQFADFVAWQEERLQGETLKSLLDYWRVRLDGIPKQIVLPFDRPRPARPTFRGAKQYFVAESLRLEKLDALADTTGTTRFMVLLAAFGVLLARYSGQNDIVVGSPFANRLTPEAETMIGFFNNTLILRVEQPDELSFRQLLGRVRDTVVGASDHQELSFETLVRALQPVRDVQRMALFQVNFRYQNIQATPLAFTGLAAEPLDVDNGFAKFDLACEMTADANRLRGYIEYSADLFDRRTAQRIAGDFQTLLVEVVTNPDLALQALHSQREESLLTH